MTAPSPDSPAPVGPASTGTDAAPVRAARRRAQFHTLTIAEVRPLTDQSIEVTFAVPDELAGQFDYAPGQYVALRMDMDGEEVRRSYSICRPPTPGSLSIAIKRDQGGLFSNWANDNLRSGDQMQVMSPQGAFIAQHRLTSLNDAEEIRAEVERTGGARFVCAAAGSGITPMIAIITSLLQIDGTAVDLIYANRSAGDVMFVDELADLKDRCPQRLAIHHVLSREQRVSPMHSGRIDADKMRLLLDTIVEPSIVDEWFLCGPMELVQLIRDELDARGVNSDDVRFELFTTGENSGGQRGAPPVVVDESGDNIQIRFQLDGLSSEVKTPRGSRETVLNAALRARSEVPFACAGGVCGTCRAKVVEGTVDMAENFALEADDVDAGYVLTCQSRPTSDSLIVDYDA